MTDLRTHMMNLNGIAPNTMRTITVRTTSGERLPDMQIPASAGYKTLGCPTYWSTFYAADWAANILGRRDILVGYA